MEEKRNQLANGPWDIIPEFTVARIDCKDPLMGPAKGKWTGNVRRYCFNNTLYPPVGECTPKDCNLHRQPEPGGFDSAGNKMLGSWAKLTKHGENASLYCRREFLEGPKGYWEGEVHRQCYAGELQPAQDACVPYNCVPWDEDQAEPELKDVEYKMEALLQLDPQFDTNGLQVRGPWLKAEHGAYSTLSCKTQATYEIAPITDSEGIVKEGEVVRYVGEVRRKCHAGELGKIENACIRAPCDYTHDYNRNHDTEFLLDTENQKLYGPWPKVKDEEYSQIRCDDKEKGPDPEWDFSGIVQRKCVTGILQEVEGRCFYNNCSIIEQDVPNVGGRDEGQIGVVVDVIGQKLFGPWPFTEHDMTATIDCAGENGVMDPFNAYVGTVTRKCFGGRFLEVKGECKRVVLMDSNTARCVCVCVCVCVCRCAHG